jgi:hypothetical protein
MSTKTQTLVRVATMFGLLIPVSSTAQILFQSNLDSNTGWIVLQEPSPSSLATFGYDYSALGIPPSPNGGGSTLGLRLAANANGTIQAITAATTASFSGQFRVTFDFWGNTVGPLPGGGTGSTEHLGGGVGFSGTAPRKGASALTTIEGNAASRDWRLDIDGTSQVLATGYYNPLITSLEINATTSADPNFFFTAPFPGQQAPPAQGDSGIAFNGTIAFGWHTMKILADTVAGTAEFTIDSTYLGTLDQRGTPVSIEGSGSLTLLDSFVSVSSGDLTTDLVFAVFDNYKVEVVPEPTVAAILGLSALTVLRRRRRSREPSLL